MTSVKLPDSEWKFFKCGNGCNML